MKIVLWKMGSLEYKIFPTRSAIDKLTEILRNLPDENINHLVWGPDVTVEEVEVDLNSIGKVVSVNKADQLKFDLQEFVDNWLSEKTKVVDTERVWDIPEFA